MARKTLGYEELQWKCPNCEGINPGPEKTCGNCGAPQPEDVKFEQASRGELLQDEATKARAKAGPDIHCPYCGARNPGNAESCSQCGGDLVGGKQRESGRVLGAFKTGPAQNIPCPHCGTENPGTAKTCSQCGGSMHVRKEEPVEAATSPKIPEKKRPPVVLFVILAVVCCAAAALIYFIFFRTESLTGTVEGVGWELSVDIEGLVPVEYNDWRDQIPSGAEVISCDQEVRSIENEPQPNSEEVCGTPYSVDTGSGVAEVVQDCEYHVYDDYCTYSVIEWAVVDTVSLTGNDFNPEWPDPELTTEQRLGQQTEQYLIYFDTHQGAYTYSTADYDYFQQFEIGSQWNLEVNAIGGVQSVSP
jgi:ribosomal protein L40E